MAQKSRSKFPIWAIFLSYTTPHLKELFVINTELKFVHNVNFNIMAVEVYLLRDIVTSVKFLPYDS